MLAYRIYTVLHVEDSSFLREVQKGVINVLSLNWLPAFIFEELMQFEPQCFSHVLFISQQNCAEFHNMAAGGKHKQFRVSREVVLFHQVLELLWFQ